MKKNLSVLVFLLLVFIGLNNIYADKNLLKYLPVQGEMAPWAPSEKAATYADKQLYDYINGGAEIYYEYGFTAVVTQEFFYEDQSLVVEIYQMSDAAAAFGIYSINRDSAKPAPPIGDDATLFDYHLTFWQDKYYVVIMGYSSDEKTREILKKFAEVVSKKISTHAQMPSLISRLPGENRVPRSERWVEGILSMNGQYYFGLENVWQVDGNLVKAGVADYSAENYKATLIVVEYPDKTSAAGAAKMGISRLNEKLQLLAQDTDEYTGWQDSKNRFYFLSRNETSIGIVIRGNDENFAKQLLKNLFE